MEFWSDRVVLPYTLCVWVRPLLSTASSIIFMLLNRYNHMYTSAVDGKISVSVNQTCPTALQTPKLQQMAWQHMCLTISPTVITLYYHNLTFTKLVADMTECPMPLYDRNGSTLYLGSQKSTIPYSGQFSYLRFYERELTPGEVEELQKCGPGPTDLLLPNEVALIGNVRTVVEQQREPCLQQHQEFVALFKLCNDHRFAREFCDSMTGRLINETDDYSRMVDEILKSKDVDEPEIFVWTNEMEEDGKQGVALSITREGHMFHTTKYACSYILHAAACILPINETVYKKGRQVKEMKLNEYNGKLVLLSENMIITRYQYPKNQSAMMSLVMISYGQIWAYSVLGDNQALLGRRLWHSTMDNMTMMYAISFCKEGFTCDDGQCVPLNSRCNGIFQCRDHSDEQVKCHIMEDPPSSYRKSACPEPRPIVKLCVDVKGINSVSMDTNEVGLGLSITTTWRDNRLTFLNLQNSSNTLEYQFYNLLWVPYSNYLDAHYKDNHHLHTGTNVQQLFLVRPTVEGTPFLDDSYEGLRYNGNETEVSRNVQYSFTVSCDYDFATFPFDTQECFFTMALRQCYSCQPVWSREDQGVRVQGNSSSISMYFIDSPRFTIPEDHVITLQFLITRRYESYLFTTFLPCIVLCLLAQLTLSHFQLKDFTDRITVTLSLLIVLASLFSQLSSSLPSAPQPKLVDFFFFYCIVRVGFIFCLHSCIDKSIKTEVQKEPKPNEYVTKIMEKKDSLMSVNMKIAWPHDSRVQSRTWCKLSPQTINWVGFIAVLVTDVAVSSIMVYWAWKDHMLKTERFYTYNYTSISN